jgi:sugar phosphate isomerase/epimerase
MIKLGTTTLPLCGWLADPKEPAWSRERRLAAMRRLAEEYGLAAVELTLDLAAVYPHVFDSSYYQEVAALQQELGLTCTVHLPFLWVDPASLNESIRRASMGSLRESLALTGALEVEAYVLHLWGAMTSLIAAQLQHPVERALLLEAIMGQADRSLEELCQLVDAGRLCIENLEDDLFPQAVALIERHGTSICLDAGHLVWQGGDILTHLRQHGSRIREVHLHDAAARAAGGGLSQPSDHMALGQGQVDYAGLLRALEEMDFQGAVILEVNTRADLEQSLERLRAMPSPPEAI